MEVSLGQYIERFEVFKRTLETEYSSDGRSSHRNGAEGSHALG